MSIDDSVNDSGRVEFDLWKQRISKSFSEWINSLSPDRLPESEPDDEPDLYSFFAALAALQTETRKLSRKSAESLASFSDTLDRIESSLVKNGSALPDCTLQILGIYDRILRIKQKLGEAPSHRKIFNDNRWVKYHSNIYEAMKLVEINCSDLLRSMGLVRIESKGQPFDPEKMVAAEVERNCSVPDNTVIEELSCGYIFEEKVIKIAEVKVARNI